MEGKGITLEFSKEDRLHLLLWADAYRVQDIIGRTGAKRLAKILENPTEDNLAKLQKVQQWISWALEYYEIQKGKVNDGR